MKSKHFAIASAITFAGVISLLHSGSYAADINGNSGLFITIGCVLVAAGVGWIVYKYIKQGPPPKQ